MRVFSRDLNARAEETGADVRVCPSLPYSKADDRIKALSAILFRIRLRKRPLKRPGKGSALRWADTQNTIAVQRRWMRT